MFDRKFQRKYKRSVLENNPVTTRKLLFIEILISSVDMLVARRELASSQRSLRIRRRAFQARTIKNSSRLNKLVLSSNNAIKLRRTSDSEPGRTKNLRTRRSSTSLRELHRTRRTSLNCEPFTTVVSGLELLGFPMWKSSVSSGNEATENDFCLNSNG